MKTKIATILLLCAATCSFLTVISHMACIWLGPECFAIQLAPPELIESSRQGTILAPIATIIVSMIFFIIGLYGLSAAKFITPLPLLSKVICILALLCTVRGTLPIQLWLRKPDQVSDLALNYGLGWLFVGVCFTAGYFLVVRNQSIKS